MAAAADASSWAASRSADRSRARARALATGDPASRAIPSLAWSRWGQRAPLGQGGARVPHGAARPDDQAGADQGLEGVGERDHLAGAADPAPRHGRDEAVVDPVDQEPAQLRPDPGVAADEVAEPGHQQRPRLGGLQPRRPADRPAEQQVALVVPGGVRPRSTEASQPVPVVTP